MSPLCSHSKGKEIKALKTLVRLAEAHYTPGTSKATSNIVVNKSGDQPSDLPDTV